MTPISNPNEDKRILIVEDDQLIQDLYSRILKTEGYNVETVADGGEALKKILEGGYDLILLDMMLPTMSGLDILKNLRVQHPRIPNRGIIILTNLDQSSVTATSLEMGASKYYIKDQFTPEHMVEVVKGHMATYAD